MEKCSRCGEEGTVIEIAYGKYFCRPRRFSKCKKYKMPKLRTQSHTCGTEIFETPEQAKEAWAKEFCQPSDTSLT